MSSPNKQKTDDRFEQTSLSAERIDRAAGIIYGVRVMKVESDNGYGYSLEAQRAIVGRYEQMPVGVSHDYDGKPMTVTAAWGTLFNPRMDALGTVADLRYLQSDQLTPKIIEDAQWQIDNPDKPGIFSLSAVTRIRREQGNVVEDFIPVRVDVVVRGATTKRFFEQSTNQGEMTVDETEVTQPTTAAEHTAAALHSALDAVLADDSAGKDKAKKLAKIIKAMHDDEEEAEAETVETNTADAADAEVTEEKPEAAAEEKPELTETEIKAKEDEAAREREEKQEQAHDALQGRFEQLLVKFTELEKRVSVKETVMPSQQRMEQDINATTAGIDLKKYWNDK